MSFVVPKIWREPTSYATDCYLRLTPQVKSLSEVRTKYVQYQNLLSAIRLVPLSNSLPVILHIAAR